MKTTYKLFCTVCMAGVLAFLASSCKKNEQKGSIEVVLPQFEEVAGEPSEIDRAYIDYATGNFYWNANDSIMFYNIDNEGNNTQKAIFTCDETAEGTLRTEFTYASGQDIVGVNDHFFAFYPVKRIVNGLQKLNKENREYFNTTRRQNYTVDTYGKPTIDPRAMALACETTGPEGVIQFKHIFGICRLRLLGDAVVDSIQLVDSHWTLTGKVSMRLHEVQMNKFQALMNNYSLQTDLQSGLNPSFVAAWKEYADGLGYMANREGNILTLNCHSADAPAGIKLNTSSVTEFFFSVRPGALIEGFQIKVYHDGKTTPKVITKYDHPQNSYVIKPGQLKGFAPGIENAIYQAD